jgi:hypothetical protein
MRVAILSAAAAFVVFAPDSFAQTEAPKGHTGAYQPAGTPPPHTPQVHCRRRTVVQAWTWRLRTARRKQSKRLPAVQPLMRPTAPPRASAFPGRLEVAAVLAKALLLAGHVGRRVSSVARELATPPMLLFARRFEHAMAVTV